MRLKGTFRLDRNSIGRTRHPGGRWRVVQLPVGRHRSPVCRTRGFRQILGDLLPFFIKVVMKTKIKLNMHLAKVRQENTLLAGLC
jgi:hypothetical protein